MDLISSAKQISSAIADFILAGARISLYNAPKECYETEYWLELMQKAELLPEEIVKVHLHDCGSIRRMLISSINTVKTKQTDRANEL